MISTYVPRLSAQRPQTTHLDGVVSKHGFSFGDHYNPTNTHHGRLVAHNEEFIAPQRGFDTHPHRDMEIITWVLSGSLLHQDSSGNSGIIYPGLIQRMSAGTGILHSERNDSNKTNSPTHFIQMWVMPDEFNATPSYGQFETKTQPGELIPLVSGDRKISAGLSVSSVGSTLFVADLLPGQQVTLPAARYHHVSVCTGTIFVDGCVDQLSEGSLLEITNGDGEQIRAVTASQILVWQFMRDLRD